MLWTLAFYQGHAFSVLEENTVYSNRVTLSRYVDPNYAYLNKAESNS